MLHNHVFLYAIALALASVGFIANFYYNDSLKPGIKPGKVGFLGFPLGSGAFGLLLLSLVALALTGACFWQANFFTFLPGINMAFELGGIAVIWLRLFQSK